MKQHFWISMIGGEIRPLLWSPCITPHPKKYRTKAIYHRIRQMFPTFHLFLDPKNLAFFRFSPAPWQALSLFSATPWPSRVTWNASLSSCEKAAMWRQALALLDLMLRSTVEADDA